MTDSLAKTGAGLAIGLGSLALVGEGFKMAKGSFDMKPGKKGKGKTNFSSKPLIKGGVNILVGTALLGAASQAASGL